jgi:hypothetical protein
MLDKFVCTVSLRHVHVLSHLHRVPAPEGLDDLAPSSRHGSTFTRVSCASPANPLRFTVRGIAS